MKCPSCLQRFQPARRWQIYCSTKCQRRAAMTRFDQARRKKIIDDYLAGVPKK